MHIGYIYNSLERYVEAIPWLVSGINTREEGVDEARFYFTLAESYARTDRRDKVSYFNPLMHNNVPRWLDTL